MTAPQTFEDAIRAAIADALGPAIERLAKLGKAARDTTGTIRAFRRQLNRETPRPRQRGRRYLNGRFVPLAQRAGSAGRRRRLAIRRREGGAS